jgi:hypothetical protein
MVYLFERLPPEIWQDIYSRLDYQSLIRLGRAYRFFQRTVDPQNAPWLDKLAFVMRAEKDFAQHFPRYIQGQEHPGNFACYRCWRVRVPEYFDVKQPHTVHLDHNGRYIKILDDHKDQWPHGKPQGTSVVTLRRFCIECGVRDGIHAPGDLLETRMGQEFWVCSCRTVWPKPSVLKCNDCGTNCPFKATSRRKS